MKWQHVVSGGEKYDLSHLQDFSFTFIQPAKGDKPAREYGIDVSFSWHCWSRTAQETDADLIRHSTEVRCFCPERYQHSFLLQNIVTTLADRMCRQTGKGNILTVELVEDDGTKHDYEMYFSLKKVGKKRNLLLQVESAYIRRVPDEYRLKKKPIRFDILVFNVKHDKKIRP